MAIINWLEKNVHGDSNFIGDIKNYGRQGAAGYNAGVGTFDQGVGGIQDLNQTYTNRLNSGAVLPSSVYKAFNSLRGNISDTAARDQTALGSGLAQSNAQNGGRMSPEQLAALKLEGENSINDQQFNATKDVGVQQAQTELVETNKLMDRVESARNAILNAGQFRMQLGQQAQIASLLARLDRNKAIASTIMQGVSMGMGK